MIAHAAQLKLQRQSVSQTARDLGISNRTVRRIREATHITVIKGTAVPLPRCCDCGGLLTIVPCRACMPPQEAA
ncbi:MAG TPA: helix-turn-helix domain-containing protein [Caulobacteraceae bacterium]|nr:helix-turn-helix domain-containing protein [Caulobacteraceae bacterium]